MWCTTRFYFRTVTVSVVYKYINDLPECLRNTRPRLFADDTNLTASSHSGMVMTEWSIGGKKLWKSLFGIILEKIGIP